MRAALVEQPPLKLEYCWFPHFHKTLICILQSHNLIGHIGHGIKWDPRIHGCSYFHGLLRHPHSFYCAHGSVTSFLGSSFLLVYGSYLCYLLTNLVTAWAESRCIEDQLVHQCGIFIAWRWCHIFLALYLLGLYVWPLLRTYCCS